MFMGEFSHAIDSKGRLIIPAKFRDELGVGCVITIGFDKCLTVYTRERWEEFSAGLARKKSTKSNARAMQRFIFANAAELEFDRQGRILIPASLRKFAHLTKDAVIIGAADRVEIWDKSAYETYFAEIAENMEILSESLEDDFEGL